MQFFNFLAFGSLPAVLALPASPVLKRDAAAVASAIATVSTQIVALNTSVTNFEGGLFDLTQALDVQSKTKALSSDLSSAVSATTASANFTDLESFTVGVALLQLEPKIFSVLDNIESKKSDFDRVLDLFSLSSTVKQSLVQQASLSADLGTAIQEKLTPALASAAPAINSAIASAFAAAISVYSEPGGVIPLPPLPTWL